MKKAMGKKEIFASYGIDYSNGKILAPMFGYIPLLLIDGNSKLGKTVWTFSTLAGCDTYTVTINGKEYKVKGTCPCNCVGCYAKTGFYRMDSTIRSNAIKTILSRKYPDFVKRAINAQIKADKISFVRIHASGDFFSDSYADLWVNVVKDNTSCKFWTYTKKKKYETMFDCFGNANIVKSLIPNCGKNYGECDYIIAAYEKLMAAGKRVHICRCGIDENQHCNTCKGCSENEYVLFIEHSTSYQAKKDKSFPAIVDLIESQQSKSI